MLGYRHIFHAGNFADVHKHAIVCTLLGGLQKKEAGLCYIDTHGGAGRYDLHSAEAQKNTEYRAGIERLWQRSDLPAALTPYLSALRSINQHSPNLSFPRFYPGSPRLVRELLRLQDRMILTELHPTDIVMLKQEFEGDRQTAVHHLDAYLGLKAFLPPKERRGLVLIDPAYELRDEGACAANALISAWHRWPQGVFALWYPLTHRVLADYLHQKIVKANVKKTLVIELHVRPPTNAHQLTGSGMLILNPPWGAEETLKNINSWLANALAVDCTGQQAIWLAE